MHSPSLILTHSHADAHSHTHTCSSYSRFRVCVCTQYTHDSCLAQNDLLIYPFAGWFLLLVFVRIILEIRGVCVSVRDGDVTAQVHIYYRRKADRMRWEECEDEKYLNLLRKLSKKRDKKSYVYFLSKRGNKNWSDRMLFFSLVTHTKSMEKMGLSPTNSHRTSDMSWQLVYSIRSNECV